MVEAFPSRARVETFHCKGQARAAAGIVVSKLTFA